MRKSLYLIAFFIGLNISHAQLGGEHAFRFLNLSENARVAALGGHLISSYDSLDVNTGVYNSANTQRSHKNRLAINFLPLKQGIKKSSLAYVAELPKVGLLNFHIEHIGYGEIPSTDILGNSTGTINPQEYALGVSKSFEQGPFRLGAGLQFAGSNIGNYKASALLLEMGGTYLHPKRDLQISMNLDNLGFALKKYTKESDLNLPINVSTAVSFKPEHMPVRFHFTTHNLQNWDIQYLDPSNTFEIDSEGNKVIPEKKTSEQIFRHLNLGLELELFKNLHFRMGYNHLRRKELKTENKGGSGFSFGGMMRIKKITVEFAKAYYFAGSGSAVISLTTDLSSLSKK